jgi:hypothetical protein
MLMWIIEKQALSLLDRGVQNKLLQKAHYSPRYHKGTVSISGNRCNSALRERNPDANKASTNNGFTMKEAPHCLKRTASESSLMSYTSIAPLSLSISFRPIRLIIPPNSLKAASRFYNQAA